MKNFILEWGIPILIAIAGVSIYLFYSNDTFSKKIKRAFDEKPFVSYEGGALYIDGFDFSSGMIGFNIASGDLDGLNDKVYDELQGRTGQCEVFINISNTDKYGNSKEEYQSVGFLDLDELNRYKKSIFWKRSGGLQKALVNHADTPSVSTNNMGDLNETLAVAPNPVNAVPKQTNGTSTVKFAPGSRTFRINSIYGTPQTFYKIVDEKLVQIKEDEESRSAYNYWEAFVSNIQSIEATPYSDNVAVKIQAAEGEKTFYLTRISDKTFRLVGNPTLLLEITSPNEITIYFCEEDKCVSLSTP